MNNLESLQEYEESQENKERKSQQRILMDLCDEVELFHSSDEEGYATVVICDHKKNLLLKGSEFKKYLLKKYYDKTNSSVSDKVLQEALMGLEAKALYEGEKHEVFLRHAHLGNSIYLDLADESFRAIEIKSDGWRVVDEPPVKFRRVSQMRPLPVPENVSAPEAIQRLKRFMNVESERDFMLLVSWLISSIGTNGPFIVLALYGEQGTSKSTTVKVLRSFTDPNASPLRRPPKNTDDLMVSAKSNFVVAIDNMSKLSSATSDDLCVLSTGGGISKRKLYTDDEEVVLDAKRPIIANGIDDFIVKGDLASRSIILNLPVIQEEDRVTENDFWESFSKHQPCIFGAILSAVAQGLKSIASVKLDFTPRMADAWRFITAAESAFGWEQGACLKAFWENQREANEVVLNSTSLYPFIKEIAKETFFGTAQNLLDQLKVYAPKVSLSEQRYLPTTPKELSTKIRRLAPSLRLNGINVAFSKTSGSNSKRMIKILEENESCDACVASDAKLDGLAPISSSANRAAIMARSPFEMGAAFPMPFDFAKE